MGISENYDVKLKSRISTTKYHKVLNIENKNGNYKLATRDLFSVVIILKLLLEKEDFNNFYAEIIKNIETLEKELTTVSIKKVLYKMGFPDNYKDLLNL